MTEPQTGISQRRTMDEKYAFVCDRHYYDSPLPMEEFPEIPLIQQKCCNPECNAIATHWLAMTPERYFGKINNHE